MSDMKTINMVCIGKRITKSNTVKHFWHKINEDGTLESSFTSFAKGIRYANVGDVFQFSVEDGQYYISGKNAPTFACHFEDKEQVGLWNIEEVEALAEHKRLMLNKNKGQAPTSYKQATNELQKLYSRLPSTALSITFLALLIEDVTS